MIQQFCLTTSAPRKSGGNKALWLIGIGLLANAAVMLFARGQVPDIVLDRAAMAQATPAAPNGPAPGSKGYLPMIAARSLGRHRMGSI